MQGNEGMFQCCKWKVYFQESAGRFGEWLNMKEKESKVTTSVFESWGQENDGSFQKLGSYEAVYSNHLVRGLFILKTFFE